MTMEQYAAETKYLDLYDRYLDEPNADKRRELVIEMNIIEEQNGWN